MKELPLRMEANVVARLDEARERLGLKTRRRRRARGRPALHRAGLMASDR